MIMLSIDPGTNCTGVSFFEIAEDKSVKIIHVETIQAAKLAKKYGDVEAIYGSRLARIMATVERIRTLMEMYSPIMVCSESPYMGSFAQSFAALTELLHAIANTVRNYDPGIGFEIIDPSSVKKNLGVKGTSGDKSLMTEAVQKRSLSYDQSLQFDSFDEHSIDSIAVGLYFIDNYLNGTLDNIKSKK